MNRHSTFGPSRLKTTDLNGMSFRSPAKRAATNDSKPITQVVAAKNPRLQMARKPNQAKVVTRQSPKSSEELRLQQLKRARAAQIKASAKKSKKKFKLFSLTKAETLVFAAGAFFASGLIAMGFYMGISRPSATANNTTPEPVVYQVSANVDESGHEVPVDVEVDPGIDIQDVDWSPPKPIEPDMPARFRIPSQGIDAPVRSLGITRTGRLAAPNYANQVGWFDQSSRPGSAGTVVMDGHYGIPAGTSVFGRLHELNTGDVFEIVRGDGQVLTYAVENIESHAVDSVPMDRLIASDGQERLNLITCGGGWNSEIGTYDHRTLVFAKRL